MEGKPKKELLYFLHCQKVTTHVELFADYDYRDFLKPELTEHEIQTSSITPTKSGFGPPPNETQKTEVKILHTLPKFQRISSFTCLLSCIIIKFRKQIKGAIYSLISLNHSLTSGNHND